MASQPLGIQAFEKWVRGKYPRRLSPRACYVCLRQQKLTEKAFVLVASQALGIKSGAFCYPPPGTDSPRRNPRRESEEPQNASLLTCILKGGTACTTTPFSPHRTHQPTTRFSNWLTRNSHNLTAALYQRHLLQLFTTLECVCHSKAMDSQVCHLFFSINCVYVFSMQGSFVCHKLAGCLVQATLVLRKMARFVP